MSRDAQPLEPFLDQLTRRTRRGLKYARRIGLNVTGRRVTPAPVFIMGAQRSGTRVPLLALERSPDILTFREGARPYFRGGRLLPDVELERLIAASPFPTLVLKPLCESHRARQVLERFPTARVIWIFRRPEDTARSASVKWTSGAEAVTRLVDGTLPADDWRRGGLTPDALAVVRRLFRPGLSLHHANVLMWYLRNRLVLDQDLFSHPRVLVVRYEDLSGAPLRHFPRLFEFVGHPLREAYLSDIHDRSVRRASLDDVPADVMTTCEALLAEIEARYAATLSPREREGEGAR